MSIRHISYLACDFCLEVCDWSDGDTAAEARAIGRAKGWRYLTRTPFGKAADICPKCQQNPLQVGGHDE